MSALVEKYQLHERDDTIYQNNLVALASVTPPDRKFIWESYCELKKNAEFCHYKNNIIFFNGKSIAVAGKHFVYQDKIYDSVSQLLPELSRFKERKSSERTERYGS